MKNDSSIIIGKIYKIKDIENNDINSVTENIKNKDNGPLGHITQLQNENNKINVNIKKKKKQISNPEQDNIIKTNFVSEEPKEPILDETRKKGLEFLIRLLCFDNKLYCKIKYSPRFNMNNIKIENGFIFNYKIIESYKKFYDFEKLIYKFKSNYEMEGLFNKYKNNMGYISGKNMDNFINEVFNIIPKDYIKEINEKNNFNFLSDLKNKDLIIPLTKYKDNQQYIYFEDSVLLDETLGRFLLNEINNADECRKIKFMIANEKLIIIYYYNIYIGKINEKIIFIPEIMMLCQDFGDLKKLFDELKTLPIQNILLNTKRKNNNISDIGIYKNTNIKVYIIQGNYIINQREEELKQEIINIINIIIDLKIIRKKMKASLNKNSEYEKYYSINIDWLKKYIDHFNLNDLYNNQIINQTLENIIFNSKDNLSHNDILEKARLQHEFNKIINNFSEKMISNKFESNISKDITKIEINDVCYYLNFFLISENTSKKIINSNSLYFNCYFGDNKIFLVFNEPNRYFINIYYLDKSYNTLPELFLKFNGQIEISNCLSLLKEKGYINFGNYYLLFGNQDINIKDYASPIFDNTNKEIGYAYRYDSNIKDYTPYIITNEYKTILKLYFNYIKLHQKSNTKNANYFCLINNEYIKKYKEHYNYIILEQNFSNNNFIQNLTKLINENSDYIISDKMLTLIIKSLPNNINKNIIDKNKLSNKYENIKKLPISKKVLNTNYYYYDDFELIDKELYSLLVLNKDNIELCQECFFINNHICIKLPKKLNQNTSSSLYIYGSLNQYNIFKTKYLLEYNIDKDFIKNFEQENQKGGFDKYLISYKFKNNIIEQLTDIKNNPIGLIYNLNDNNKNIIKVFDIKNEYLRPPLIVLKSVEFIPYMNSILQCFCQIEKFVNYFKYNKYAEQIINKYDTIDTPCLTKAFKTLIDNLWPLNNNNNFYIPLDFKNSLILINPSFKSFEQIESNDLINFIIMILHEELNKKKKNENNIFNNNLIFDRTNENLILNNFIQQFVNNNVSIISDLFYWTTKTVVRCMNCGIKKYDYQINTYLIFPLKEVSKYKNNIILSNINKNIITIYDCFQYYQKIETLTGENAIPCDICKLTCANNYKTNIYSSPEIFIIIIDKDNDSQIKFDFYEEINLYKYIQTNNFGYIYKLFGIVSELDNIKKKFVSYCKSPINYSWYKYDDDKVEIVNNFKNEIIDSSNPCILFYQKLELK